MTCVEAQKGHFGQKCLFGGLGAQSSVDRPGALGGCFGCLCTRVRVLGTPPRADVCAQNVRSLPKVPGLGAFAAARVTKHRFFVRGCAQNVRFRAHTACAHVLRTKSPIWALKRPFWPSVERFCLLPRKLCRSKCAGRAPNVPVSGVLEHYDCVRALTRALGTKTAVLVPILGALFGPSVCLLLYAEH